MTSVIIPEFVYDGIASASASAGQLLSGGLGASVLSGSPVPIVQVETVRTSSVDIEPGTASGGSPPASGTALVDLVVFEKSSADKE